MTLHMPAPALGAEDPCTTVLKSMKAEVSQKAYRIRTTDLDPDTGKVKSSSSAEVQPPDRMHLFNDGGEQLVVRGKGTFTKAKGESWKKSPFDLQSPSKPGSATRILKSCKDWNAALNPNEAMPGVGGQPLQVPRGYGGWPPPFRSPTT